MYKRILIVHNCYLHKGGEDTVVNNEYNSLKNAGYDIHLLIFKNIDFKFYNPLSYFYVVNTVFNIFSFFRIIYVLLSKRIEIMHVHNLYYNASPSIFWAAKLVSVKTVMTIHNYRLFCLNANFFRDGQQCFDCKNKKSYYPGIKNACFKSSRTASSLLAFNINFNKWITTWYTKVDKYIVVNLFTRELLIQFGVESYKIFYKSNYLPNLNLTNKIKKDYYFFAGRLSKEKGIFHLLDTFNKNRKKIIIAGEGDLAPIICENLTENISWVGFKSKEETLDLMSNAKALIFSSIWIESMPMTIIESLSIGTIPIIAYSINTEKMIDDKINGILYDPNDVNGLDNALNYFEQLSYDQINEMSKACILKFNAMYTEKAHLEKIIEIYFK